MSWEILYFIFFAYGILIYSVALLGSYIALGIYSTYANMRHMHKHSFTDYSPVAKSSIVPSVSIIAPAYNESATIVENVRSLFSVYYNDLEIIVINDGSKDDSLNKLIEAYNLIKVPFYVHEQIPTKPIRGVYKSTNPAYKKLIVVDKINGGKADALNVGINISSQQYITCIDVDCVLEQDAILRMVKPFMTFTDRHVIATGGVIRVANSCDIEGGKITKVRVPSDMLARIQTVEYMRAFLLGRMAWSSINGLLIISGAFGMFDREIVIASGGYNTTTVGEDMELVVRMRVYMEDRKRPYSVEYISDPLCWTEVPTSYKILWRQRDRWLRGTIETLSIHRGMFFNYKYRLLGLVSYPYWFFFEMLAPVVEFFGWLFFFLLLGLGMIQWPFFLLLLFFIVALGYSFSAFSILMEMLTFRQYKDKGDIRKLFVAFIVEPVIFHLYTVAAGLRGFLLKLLRTDTGWGEMTRGGFNRPQNK